MTKDYCDRCGKEITDIYRVSIGTMDSRIRDKNYCYSGYEQTIHADLCDDCVNDLKLQMLFKNRACQDVPKDDVKEQFFNALQELVKAAMEGSEEE